MSTRVEPEVCKSTAHMLRAPEGTFYIHIMEGEDNVPIRVVITVGKSGAVIRAWCDAMSRIISRGLRTKAFTLTDIMEDLSSQTSDRSVQDVNGVKLRSGPEALFVACQSYVHDRYKELKETLGARSARSNERNLDD